MNYFICFWFASVLRKRCWLHEESFVIYYIVKRGEEKTIKTQLKIDSPKKQSFFWSTQWEQKMEPCWTKLRIVAPVMCGVRLNCDSCETIPPSLPAAIHHVSLEWAAASSLQDQLVKWHCSSPTTIRYQSQVHNVVFCYLLLIIKR